MVSRRQKAGSRLRQNSEGSCLQIQTPPFTRFGSYLINRTVQRFRIMC